MILLFVGDRVAQSMKSPACHAVFDAPPRPASPHKIPVIGTTAYLKSKELVRWVHSVMSKKETKVEVQRTMVVHNADHPHVEDTLARLRKEHDTLVVLDNRINIGLAASWNAIILADLQAPYWYVNMTASIWGCL